jgi:O-antigen/teichoic acid export membrane protein
MSFKEKVFKASGYSILGEIVAKVIGPLGFLILTRLLSPDDFGIVAIATTILGFVYVLSDFGIGKVIIQERGDDEYLLKINNVSFWFSAILGSIFCFLIMIFSPKLAELFGEPKSEAVIRAMALQVIFYSLSTVQTANKRRDLNFKFLFYLRLITVAVPFIVSIPLAFAGFGYWAIVGGQVFGSLSNAAGLWISSKWKPSFSFDISILKKVLSKSIWSTIEQIFVWIPIGLDTYLISNYLTSYSLGMYSTSRTLFSTAITLTLGAILPVLFSAFSEIKNNNLLLRNTILLSQKIVFFLAAFMGTGIYVFRHLIEKIIFSEKWIGVSDIFGILFLIMGFEYFYTVLVEGLRSKGHFRIIAINTVVCIILTIPVLFIAINSGLKIYVIIRASLLYLSGFGILIYSKKILNISFFDCIKNCKNTIFCTIGILGFNYLISLLNMTVAYKYIFLFLAFILVLTLYILFEKQTFRILFNQFSFKNETKLH